ncbi:TetR/AcrR family transcriptional regulator [Brevibacterium sp. HMSC22B09]|uniref:TetR/AcrR family transcriptional regulator n=1 Tax=Brevibacterium sp. HMSC22B09 TaxID=1581055 RepID=UPI0021097551|nr:TetR/AcrR family transcriptional regulator [Brevibacterium sp. HMSC22B09]
MKPSEQATETAAKQASEPASAPTDGSAGNQPVEQAGRPAGRPAASSVRKQVTKPAGRPAASSVRKQATKPVRERLLDSADALLFIHGVISTPVDRILKDAQASPPSLYSHFGSKEGLIAAALRRRLHIWTGVWDAEIAAADCPKDRALALWDALTTYQGEHMTERWCAFSGTAAAIEHPSAQLQAVLDEETQLLRTRLLAAAREITGEAAGSEDAGEVSGASSAQAGDAPGNGSEEVSGASAGSAAAGSGSRAEALASALMVAYTGTMSLMLREDYPTAIAEGRASAEALIDAFTAA